MNDPSTPTSQSGEPGEQVDPSLGLPGPAEPMPIDEEQREEATLINEDEVEGEADGHPQA